MDFETVSQFSRTWGLVYLVIMFIGIVGYAFWPKSKKKFHDAAHIPLKED